MIVLSLVMVCFGIYTKIEYNDVTEAIGLVSFMPEVLGGLLLILTLVHCWGTRHRRGSCLMIYIFVMGLLTLIIFGIGIILLSVADVFPGGDTSNSLKSYVTDLELAVYTVCCDEPFELNQTKVFPCSDSPNVPEDSACYENEKLYEKAIDSLDDVCSTLELIKVENQIPNATTPKVGLVGDPATGSCGGGQPQIFIGHLNSYFIENIKYVGGGTFGIGGLLLVAVLFTCCVGATLTRSKRDQHFLESGAVEQGDSPVAMVYNKLEKNRRKQKQTKALTEPAGSNASKSSKSSLPASENPIFNKETEIDIKPSLPTRQKKRSLFKPNEKSVSTKNDGSFNPRSFSTVSTRSSTASDFFGDADI